MKTERIYLRTTPDTKNYLQAIADKHFDGKVSAVFDFMIERLDLYFERSDK
ncbi:hypothetical protein [Brevibacillus laterosporus]|uniref:hypothetical protein n=1 Tax=Brevibacillus laterosporus TaxID=1465 RepID=UPI003D1BFDE5